MCNHSKPRSRLGLRTNDVEGDVAPVDDDDLFDVVLVAPQSLASCRLLLLRRARGGAGESGTDCNVWPIRASSVPVGHF